MHRRLTLHTLAPLAALVWMQVAVTSPALAQGGQPFCQPGQQASFVFGIAALHDRLGTQTMGVPVECEHINADNGDTVQKTTTGLAYYRPSLGAVMAARRVARDLKIPASFIVGDARYLPLAAASVDAVFSYSVLQHFSRSDAAQGAGEIGRVLNHNGFAKVQMPTRFGVRCLYQQARRGFADGADFDVRYWSLGELRRLFTERVGRTRITVEGYFGIGLQQTDARLMTVTRRGVLRASHWMTAASRRLPWLTGMADSVYVEAVKA